MKRISGFQEPGLRALVTLLMLFGVASLAGCGGGSGSSGPGPGNVVGSLSTPAAPVSTPLTASPLYVSFPNNVLPGQTRALATFDQVKFMGQDANGNVVYTTPNYSYAPETPGGVWQLTLQSVPITVHYVFMICYAQGIPVFSSEVDVSFAGPGSGNAITDPVNSGNALARIQVAPVDGHTSVPAGETEQFRATGTYSNGRVADLTTSVLWSSSAISVATINQSGLLTGSSRLLLQTSQPVGAVTVTGSCGVVGTFDFQVVNALPTSLTIVSSQPAAPLPILLTRQFTATATFSDGVTRDVTSQVTFVSTNTAAATVDPVVNGLIHSVAAGTTTITGSMAVTPPYGSSYKLNATTTVSLQVTAATLQSVTLTGPPSMPNNTQGQFSIDHVTFTDGTTEPG